MVNWNYYPACSRPPEIARAIVSVFEAVVPAIDSRKHHLNSNAVLSLVAPGLTAAGFRVEASKRKADKVGVPVLFGRNGKVEKAFEADAFHELEGFVLEVEAGRACDNNQFLKDLFEACMMQDDVLRLHVAVDHPTPVRVGQRAREVLEHGHGLGDGEPSPAAEPPTERVALDVGHGVPQDPVHRAGVVDGEDVGVLELSREPDLEALGAEEGAEPGAQHLDGDGAVVLQVLGEIHGRHAAAAQLAAEQVPVGDRCLEAGEGVREGGGLAGGT